MSRKKSSAKPRYTRADVEVALQNLVKKGKIVARQDINGQTVYFVPECAPPNAPFELESYRRGLELMPSTRTRHRKTCEKLATDECNRLKNDTPIGHC
jgi:hypothetical protein